MNAQGAFRGMRVELRRGMILKMSPQHIPHAQLKADLQYALKAAIDKLGLPWKVLAEATVSYRGGFEPMPDIVVVDLAVLPEDGPIPPAAVRLIVEVADTSLADDMGEKREDYARGGLAEYWVADVAAKAIIRHAGSDLQNARFKQQEAPLAIDQPIAMLTRPAVVARV